MTVAVRISFFCLVFNDLSCRFLFMWWLSQLSLVGLILNECFCYGFGSLRLVCVKVYGDLLSRCKVDVWECVQTDWKLCGLWIDSACRVVRLWFLVASRDGIVRQAIGGSDKSRLRRYGVLDSTSGWYRAADEDIINIFRSLLIAILKDCCIGFSHACV